MEVEHVEALALESTDDPEVRTRREDDVRQRAVRWDDHGAPDGDDVRRRLSVAPDPRVQDAGELTRRIVPHDEADVVAASFERRRLELCMLDDRTPKRPRERDNDPDLHAKSLTTRD
jgi:hypothetical protein